MTDALSQVRSLIELADKCTAGPWTLEHHDRCIAGPSRQRGDWDWICLPPETEDEEEMLGPQLKDNMRFIAAARNSVEAIRELMERLKAAEEVVRAAKHLREYRAGTASARNLGSALDRAIERFEKEEKCSG